VENVMVSHRAVIGENLLAGLAGINGLEDIIRFILHLHSVTAAAVRQTCCPEFTALGMPSFRRFDARGLGATPGWTPESR
jgi:hypothetical protein